MPDDHEKARRDWRIPAELWERIVSAPPLCTSHPLGCHGPRSDAWKAMDAFFVLHTGCQWNALNETGSESHKINEGHVDRKHLIGSWISTESDASDGDHGIMRLISPSRRNDTSCARGARKCWP